MNCKYCEILLGPAETKRGLDLCVRCEMTRDEFAAAALTGLVANANWHPVQDWIKDSAKDAFDQADAMMEARKK